MTPIGPDEQVDESDVMNVQDEDGVWHRYRRRKMGVTHMKNGKLSNNFVQGAVRIVDGLKALGWVLGIIGGFLWGLTEWVIVPQIEDKIEATATRIAAPLNERLARIEELYDAHLLDIAQRTGNYPTREDLRRELDSLRREVGEK